VSGVLDDVVPLATQPVDDPAIHAHVGEETHGRRSGQPDFFARQPSGVFDRLPDVLAFEVGGASENLLEGRAVGDQIPLRSPGSVRELVDAGAEAAVHAQQGGGVFSSSRIQALCGGSAGAGTTFDPALIHRSDQVRAAAL